MRTLQITGTLAVLTLMSACGSESSERTLHDRETGETVTVASGPGVAAPRNLPAYAPLYPGAVIETSVNGVSGADDGGRRGGMVGFRTTDDPQRVAAFYRARLDASGLTERGDANMNGTIMLTAGSADEAGHGVQINISPSPDGPGSVVSMIYSSGNG